MTHNGSGAFSGCLGYDTSVVGAGVGLHHRWLDQQPVHRRV
jgi:hypothetical protein